MSALQQLLNLAGVDDPFAAAPANLVELQIAAAQERLEQRRKQIRVLDQRATDRGVDRIERLEDIVSLLFSDATYKSYPESFLDQRRWDRLTMWFQTLSSDTINGIDFKSVDRIDDWLAALSRNGCYVNSSSGTSGKNSFLAMNQADMDIACQLMVQAARWTSANLRTPPPEGFAVFVLGPSSGAYSGSLRSKLFAEAIARPGDIHYISDVPQTAQDGLELAKLNRAIAAGTARPSDIQAFQEKSRARAQQVQADLSVFLDTLIARRGEPVALLGLSTMLYQIMEMAKARGHAELHLHPASFVSVSGGKKGVDVPADFNQQLIDYFGMDPNIYTNPYGMTEMSGCCAMLPGEHAWALPPWIVPLVLEATDETLLNPAGTTGTVTGRFAFIDLLVEGRWGGLVTGDQVTIDFSPREAGINVPVIRRVDRYKDLPGDDKATCAGTIDSYVRGALEPA
jgi:hypothetical protein